MQLKAKSFGTFIYIFISPLSVYSSLLGSHTTSVTTRTKHSTLRCCPPSSRRAHNTRNASRTHFTTVLTRIGWSVLTPPQHASLASKSRYQLMIPYGNVPAAAPDGNACTSQPTRGSDALAMLPFRPSNMFCRIDGRFYMPSRLRLALRPTSTLERRVHLRLLRPNRMFWMNGDNCTFLRANKFCV